MKLMTMPSEFQKALPILKKIKDAGFQAYFVGGGVRDILLDRPIHDVDIATSSYPQETKNIFERTCTKNEWAKLLFFLKNEMFSAELMC